MWVILIGVSFGDSKYILVSLGVGVGIIVVKVFWIVWIDWLVVVYIMEVVEVSLGNGIFYVDG